MNAFLTWITAAHWAALLAIGLFCGAALFLAPGLVRGLARSWPGRLALLPVVALAGAFSWATYFVNGVPDDKKSYWANCWGWLSPEMEPHWIVLADKHTPGRKSTFHEIKNIGSEYCRAFAQTAYKAGSLLLWLSLGLAALIGFLTGAVVL